MTHRIELDEEELAELDMILCRELSESKGELRHTWDANYKDRIRHHIGLVEHMIHTTEASIHPQGHSVEEHPVGG